MKTILIYIFNKVMKKSKYLFFLVFIFLTANLNAAEVNVYSARKEALIKPLLDSFEKETGIEVNIITGKADGLIKRLSVEGSSSPADILITVDAARLERAKDLGLFQSVDSETLTSRIPAKYRDNEKKWFGLSLRSRVIVYSKDRVKNSDDIDGYFDLTDETWNKKLCVRSSSNIYNQSLLASIIAHKGSEKAEKWAKGLVNNFARKPKGGDRDQIKAVAAGQCDLALVNTYYVGGMQDSSKQSEKDAVDRVAIYWPDQDGRGAHMNVSGIGVLKASKNKDNAIKLIEYLLSDEAQQWYGEVNYEYPVVAGTPISQTLKGWGEFKQDDLSLTKLGKFNAEAVKIMDRVGWR